MKKYIAFIVADVVLFYIMWYIACSPITQEKEVTPKEKQIATNVLNGAVTVANKYGPKIIAETGGSIPVSTMAAALLMAGFCVNGGVSMFDAVNILMSAHKNAEEEAE
jgi:hypothetical protein